jgi:DNA-directed RNA polymerase subunit beta
VIMPSRTTERINFGKIKEIIAPPNLIEIPGEFLSGVPAAGCRPSGARMSACRPCSPRSFPIESYDGKVVLDFTTTRSASPSRPGSSACARGITYGAPLHVTFLLKDEKGTKEEKVFMGELPLMTPQGTFVINGAERVIVSQLHRSPGLAFEATQHPNGKMLHSSASSRTAGPGTRRSSTPATCSMSISTARSAAASF